MLYRHDIDILTFFSEQKEYLFDSETPFVSLELERLVRDGYLLKSTKLKYGEPGDHPDSFPSYAISPLGKTAVIENAEDQKEKLQEKKIAKKTYRFSVISAIAAVLSVLLTLLGLLLPLLS